MDVSIVVVSWKVKDQLSRCLQAILDYTQNLTYEVFVVDNASDDGSAEAVKKYFPTVILLQNQKNIGFAQACNQAIKQSKGTYVLLMNPDTELRENSIEKAFRVMERMPDIGIAGCKLVNPDGSLQPSVRRFPTFMSHMIMLLKLHNFFPRLKPIHWYYHNDWDYNISGYVDQVMGAFFMIRRKTLNDVGLLDQHFYIWYEEVDFCKRAIKKGWKTYYTASTAVIHHKGKSFSKKTVIAKQLIFNRSMLYYFFKHHSVQEYLLLLLVYPLSLLLAIVVQLLRVKKSRKDL
ncbi:MAG: glycosyltransferase family 2 protein [Patescibacteria group bacterium]